MLLSPVVEPPPTAEERPQSRTSGGAVALTFRRRVKLIDRVAHLLISLSGITIICAILGIGLFLLLEVLPLFQGAHLQFAGTTPVLRQDDRALLVLTDEHQEAVVVLGEKPVLHLFSLQRHEGLGTIPLTDLEGQRISAASLILHEPMAALGTDQGTIWIGTIALPTVFEGTHRAAHPSVEPEAILQATPGHRISRLAYRTAGERSIAASVVDDTFVILTRVMTYRPLVGPIRRAQDSLRIPLEGVGQPTQLLLNETCTQLIVGTSEGFLARWRLPADGSPELVETIPVVPGGSVTALSYLLGERSVAVGGSDGSVTTWSLVRDETRPDGWHLTKIHSFPSHRAALTIINPSPRDKGFLTASTDGVARLHYMTSERTLAEWQIGDQAPIIAEMAPKADGAVFLDRSGTLHHWLIHNPHPEMSWRSLFGKLWYEGYTQPEYVWQSTGGADDFEPKFSLVPLIFGTLKGTCYALLFAVPLALFGALYCSQFLEKRLRSSVKSTIELMAALPSVVLGFVTGVVLAAFVQRHVVTVLSMPVVLPLVTIGGLLSCQRVPVPTVKAFVRRYEFWVLAGWVLVGVWVAGWAGPWIERTIFGGDFEAWLLKVAGTRYDQRNALVVGWAMGFAVIPIIFTVCEDAFSAVPRHLVSASLACGASLWQTAWRVVLPAAGSGVFSAIMVGFGRAIGETMIVLMATGNTPVIDWSLFNGFRALSANIAVEIPEAPYGGTLYRVLFIAALFLFAMTFVVNTCAELIRLRLRRQLQGL